MIKSVEPEEYGMSENLRVIGLKELIVNRNVEGVYIDVGNGFKILPTWENKNVCALDVYESDTVVDTYFLVRYGDDINDYRKSVIVKERLSDNVNVADECY